MKFGSCAGGAALGWRIVVAAIALAAIRSPAAGEPVGVDLQLVIAIDVSSSMDESRRRVQREGHARAIRSAEVLAAIKSGPYGRIAIACFGWASPDYQRVIVPWTIVETPADADAVAHAIERKPLAVGGGTSISAALLFSERLLHAAGIRADRKIIDVSGDGPNNSGPLLRPTRASVLAGGVTINGLAIALRTKEERTFGPFAFKTIRSYYRDCVIGGAGAFVVAVENVADFEPAIRTKLTREIAEMHPLTQRVAYVSEDPLTVDCETPGSLRGR
jgi:hypothetical protein